jgi:hypothetical protein
MRTLLVTTGDGVMVVDGIGAIVPRLKRRTDELMAVVWTGRMGYFIYRTRRRLIRRETEIREWFEFWDRERPWQDLT